MASMQVITWLSCMVIRASRGVEVDLGSRLARQLDLNVPACHPLPVPQNVDAHSQSRKSKNVVGVAMNGPLSARETDPLSLVKADPADARFMSEWLRRGDERQQAAVLGCFGQFLLFGERAVSSPRPRFQTATRAAPVRGGAEQPAATRSAL